MKKALRTALALGILCILMYLDLIINFIKSIIWKV
jgi:hypothetical protein